MKATIESTDKVIQLGVPCRDETSFVPARIWEGVTEGGVRFHAYVTRVAVPEGRPAGDYAQFETELKATRKPSPDVAAIPLRLIL